MVPAPQHVSRRLSYKPSIFLALLCVIGTACSTTAPTGTILFEDPRGTVSLQTMADQSIQATHPVTLEPTLIAQVLRGMEIQDQERGIQRLLAGRSSPVPVFSDDQIQFLAPLLAEGLRTAAPTERVAYRVQTTHQGSMLESSITETTAGSLYAYGRQLYVTLSQYRYSPTRANLNVNDTAYRMTRPDSSGLRDRNLLFTPSAAQRSDAFDLPTGGKSTDRFLAIDYQLLQQTPGAAATSGQPAPQMGQTAPIRETSVGTSTSGGSAQSTEALAQEVEALRKELQSVQKQLGNQPTTQDNPKRKPPPPIGPQKPAP
jgi:hypothetical protein